MPAAASTIPDTNARPSRSQPRERQPPRGPARRRRCPSRTRPSPPGCAATSPAADRASGRHWLDTLARCHLRQEKLDALELLVVDALLIGTNEPGLPSLATLRRQIVRETGEAFVNLQASIEARLVRGVDTNEPEAGEGQAMRGTNEAPSTAGEPDAVEALERDTNEPGARAQNVRGRVALGMAIYAQALMKVREGVGMM